MSKIDTWLKENHKEIYDEYLTSLNKRERERVILKVSSNDTYKKIIGNDDNPFFVSAEWLETISDFRKA